VSPSLSVAGEVTLAVEGGGAGAGPPEGLATPELIHRRGWLHRSSSTEGAGDHQLAHASPRQLAAELEDETSGGEGLGQLVRTGLGWLGRERFWGWSICRIE
jgi:hypothetical protein